MPDYVSVAEAARRFGVPSATLYQALMDGKLEGRRVASGRAMVKLDDVRRVLALDGPDPLVELEQRARAVAEDLARRDAAIVAAHEADRSLAEIARRGGLSVKAVRQVLKRAGVELRSRGRRTTGDTTS